MKFELKYAFVLLCIILFLCHCKKKDADTPPIIEPTPTFTTNTVTNIDDSSAVCGGNIPSEDIGSVKIAGVCWYTQPNPTVFNDKTINEVGNGSYTSYLKNLKSYSTYFVRAYTISLTDTIYGNEIRFRTLPSSKWVECDYGIVTDLNSKISGILTYGEDVYVAVNTKGVYQYRNDWYDWIRVNTGTPELLSVTSIVRKGTEVLAGTENGLFMINGTSEALKINIGTAGSRILDVKASANDFFVTSASTNANEQNAILTSEGYEESSWTNITPIASSKWLFVSPIVNELNNVFAYNGSTKKFYLSTNKGIDWNITANDIPAVETIYGISNIASLLVVYNSDGTYTTVNGVSWNKLDKAATGGSDIRTVIWDDYNYIFYAACGNKIYSSPDFENWTKVGRDLPEAIGSIAVYGNKIYIGTLSTSAKVFKLQLK
jgi:hypothetical protein